MKDMDYEATMQALDHIKDNLAKPLGLSGNDTEALSRALQLVDTAKERQSEIRKEAVEYIMENAVFPMPEGCTLLYTTESYVICDSYDEALEKYPEVDKDFLAERLYDQNMEYGDILRLELDRSGRTINLLRIGTSEKWTGRFPAWKLDKGVPLSRVISAPGEYDDFMVYEKDGRLFADYMHHDGTDSMELLHVTDLDAFEAIMEYNGWKPKDLASCTESLWDAVMDVCG